VPEAARGGETMRACVAAVLPVPIHDREFVIDTAAERTTTENNSCSRGPTGPTRLGIPPCAAHSLYSLQFFSKTDRTLQKILYLYKEPKEAYIYVIFCQKSR
jgi:hypothetical protein